MAGITLEQHDHEGFVVVAPKGEVDIACADSLREALEAAMKDSSGVVHVCCDLEGVSFLDSTGITALLRARATGEANGVALVLAGAVGPVLRILEITSIADAIPCYSSVEEFAQTLR